VLIAFAFVHGAYRALKYFTVVGQWEGAAKTNFIPGTVMILFTVSGTEELSERARLVIWQRMRSSPARSATTKAGRRLPGCKLVSGN